jgi:hypothetical protein
MSLNPLAWIRASVRNAVLAGVGDALAELDAGGDDATAAAALRARLAPPSAPLPAPPETTNGHTEEPVSARRGRKPAADVA